MHLRKEFDVRKKRDVAVAATCRDETLTGLFPETRTEIVESRGDRRTLRSHYTALGREGTATFHFHFLPDGEVRFEKVCDGRIWRELAGVVSFQAKGDRTRVRIEMNGRTKPLIPEFTIRGELQNQIEQMAAALRERIESA